MQLITRQLSDISTCPVSWLWQGRVPRGKVTMLAGDPGLGKSFLTLDLAARVTVNADMPDAKTATRLPGTVLVLSAEDDAGDTIRPRIEAAGGDPSRVVVVDGVRRIAAPEGESGEGVRLDINLSAVERQVAQMERCRLVIIDPISAYLGEVDGHSNAQVRGLLSGLSRLAARLGPAVVCVTHLNKSGTGKAVYRMMGSLAFTAAARIVWQVSKHPDDADKRVLVLMKTNLDAQRTGLAFAIKDGRVEWDATPVQMDASSLEVEEGGHRSPTDRDISEDAVECIESLLVRARGAMGATEVMAQARARGFSHRAIKDAKRALGVTSVRIGGSAEARGVGGWMWSLPALASQDQEVQHAHPAE